MKYLRNRQMHIPVMLTILILIFTICGQAPMIGCDEYLTRSCNVARGMNTPGHQSCLEIYFPPATSTSWIRTVGIIVPGSSR